jgi:hypothetical protein
MALLLKPTFRLAHSQHLQDGDHSFAFRFVAIGIATIAFVLTESIPRWRIAQIARIRPATYFHPKSP